MPLDTGVGCHALSHGIFPIQASNPGLPHCRQVLYHLSHQGSTLLQRRCNTVQRVQLSARGCHSYRRRRSCSATGGHSSGPLPQQPAVKEGPLVGPFSRRWAEWWSSGSEVREGSWSSSGGSPVHRASGQQVSWGAGSRLGVVSCRAPEPSPRPPTNWTEVCEVALNLPLVPPYLCSLMAVARLHGMQPANLVPTTPAA